MKKIFLTLFSIALTLVLIGCEDDRSTENTNSELANNANLEDQTRPDDPAKVAAAADQELESETAFNLESTPKDEPEVKLLDAATVEITETPIYTGDREVLVEAFVMSHCPYGTQIEKGLLPVIETLKEDVDFQIKFVDYAMHGRVEIYEQMRQNCIAKTHNEKFLSYLQCYLEEERFNYCLEQSGIDREIIDNCFEETEEEYSILADFANQETWRGNYPIFNLHQEENILYGVAGSPTLVINGEVKKGISRDPQSLLEAICAEFETKPESCSVKLSPLKPAPGFGLTSTSSSSSNASCS
jgi:hypothetical protein